MKALIAKAIVALAMTAVTESQVGVVEACSATNTVDAARGSRTTDQYKSSRDVARDFVDEEGFATDDIIIESGAGTLLWEMDMSKSMANPFTTIPNGGQDASDWKAILDARSNSGHGVDKSGVSSNNNTATFRDHVRMHVKEWDDALHHGKDPYGLLESWTYKTYKPNDGESVTAPAPVAAPAPPTAPAPVAAPAPPAQVQTPVRVIVAPAPTPAPTPVAAPAPMPIVHRAG